MASRCEISSLRLENKFSSSVRLASRLVRDGFHALAVICSGHFRGRSAGRNYHVRTWRTWSSAFRTQSYGVRGLSILLLLPDDHIFWGEYFDNPNRDEAISMVPSIAVRPQLWLMRFLKGRFSVITFIT